MSNLPVVAIVGAPNVGKSTFLNRVLGRRQAVVSETAGTTRDRSYNRAEWAGREFLLVDTGGMEPTARGGLAASVTLQAKVAVEDADVILHLVDSRLGPTEVDTAVARELRRVRGRVVLAVNKLDDPGNDLLRHDFHALGEGEPHPVSASHGLRMGDLLDVIVGLLTEAEEDDDSDVPKLAIIGRPNVGKSTLLNRLLDSERAVVSDMSGTTTDSVAGEVVLEGEDGSVRYILLDTAGVNRSAKRAEGVPFYSALRTEEAIRSASVSLLVVDAVEGVVGGDLQLARRIEDAGRSCGVILNKSDLVPPERIQEIVETINRRMTDLKPPVTTISALTGSGVDEVLLFADRLRRAFERRVPTHEVAEYINQLVGRTAPPRGVKIRYGTQTGTSPPRFTVFANRPNDVPDSYVRFLENSIREKYDLAGVSVGVKVRSSR
jgi:GTP-binding protein